MLRNRLFVLCCVLTAGGAVAQTPGKVLFDGHCSRCHGIGGTGGEGPSLALPVLRHAADDETLASVITNGIPDTDMPGNWMLGEREVQQVVQYVRSLSRAEPEAVPGDSDRGRLVFEGKGACNICHIVGGDGGALGPDLSNVGAVRGAAYLRESLVSPGKKVAQRYVLVRARTDDGREITGVRVNEDSFTVQVRDESGRFHSMSKLSLEKLEKRFGESLMPSYEGELSASELDDVVSYLASLRGEP